MRPRHSGRLNPMDRPFPPPAFPWKPGWFLLLSYPKGNTMQVTLFRSCRRTRKVSWLLAFIAAGFLYAQNDPGPANNRPRSGPPGSPSAGDPIGNLTAGETAAFNNGLTVFQEVDSVSGTLDAGAGLGPRFNLDSCAGCHAQPAIGGSSPPVNPQIAVATKAGAANKIPSFLSLNGPVREARFVRTATGTADGGVHDLFVISGRSDAAGCTITQPDFAVELASNNVVFRIPTPLFGAGLIEAIDDAVILLNRDANTSAKAAFGIAGHPNRNENDGSMTRFGWKAQNKSLSVFAGEAYNVEQGVTNDIFPTERESTGGCRFNATPEDHVDPNGGRRVRPTTTPSDLIDFVFFMRFLAPPARGDSTPSSRNGEALFGSTGCALCHTPSLTTASSMTDRALQRVRESVFRFAGSQYGRRPGGRHHPRLRCRQ